MKKMTQEEWQKHVFENALNSYELALILAALVYKESGDIGVVQAFLPTLSRYQIDAAITLSGVMPIKTVRNK